MDYPPSVGNRTKAYFLCLVVIVNSGVLACGQKQSESSTETKIKVSSDLEALKGPAAPESMISDEQSRALLRKWLASQNQGDFAGGSAR